MGDDGHTASLFPHTEAINEMIRIAVANHVPQKDTWRVTLTWPVINEANDVFFLIAGQTRRSRCTMFCWANTILRRYHRS